MSADASTSFVAFPSSPSARWIAVNVQIYFWAFYSQHIAPKANKPRHRLIRSSGLGRSLRLGSWPPAWLARLPVDGLEKHLLSWARRVFKLHVGQAKNVGLQSRDGRLELLQQGTAEVELSPPRAPRGKRPVLSCPLIGLVGILVENLLS